MRKTKAVEAAATDPSTAIQQGVEAHQRGEHARAIELLENVTQGSEEAATVLALLARSKAALGDAKGAINTYEASIAAGNDAPEVRLHAGTLLAAAGRLDEAKQMFLLVDEAKSDADREALGKEKDHNLAVVCAQLGEQFEAKEWFRKAIDAGFSRSAVALFECAIKQQDFVTARSATDAYRKMEGANTMWTLMARELAKQMGENDEDFLETAVRENPGAPGPALFLVKFLLEGGREREAEPYLKMLEKSGLADGPYLRGTIAGRKAQYVAAIAHTKRALEIEPNHEGAKRQLEVLLRAMGA